MERLKFLILLVFLFNLHPAMAEYGIPLNTKEDSENKPLKPKAPSRVRISAYVDGDAVVVSSTVSVMAHVTVTDPMAGDCLFDGFVALAQDYRCSLSGASGILTLTVTVGGTSYEGQFVL